VAPGLPNGVHPSARSVAKHRENLNGSSGKGAVAVMESKLTPLWGRNIGGAVIVT